MTTSPYRFDELGRLQFERLCLELVDLQLGLSTVGWHGVPWGRLLVVPEGVSLPWMERRLSGPTVVLVIWLRRRSGSPRTPLEDAVQRTLGAWSGVGARSVLLLTNTDPREDEVAQIETVMLGPRELTPLVASSFPLRLRVPSVLGVGAFDESFDAEHVGRSTADLEEALELARVFMPTRAYAATLDVLGRHHFAALTGPPEMGKTAIARMIGLAALSGGWEVHECNRPEELWARFARERRQVFIADDAFGSTEYRPEAAERWALELDRVLRAMDDRHWLIWTSRPAPLKAGLRRIHREHGVERFPKSAEVQVDAAQLDVAEKAMILFRHAKAAELQAQAIEFIKAEGWAIVSHPHFTPERIRRFVSGRLLELSEQVGSTAGLAELVAAEIREPTTAMAASFRALSDEHRSLLVALLDTPAGPVTERELVSAFRRHTAGLTKQPRELVDRLSEHFIRVVDGSSVMWVHPSWRDLVIDELASDSQARQRFLEKCSIEGILLALSTAGGAEGERLLPLLRNDHDWDAVSARFPTLTGELDEPEINRLLVMLTEAQTSVEISDRSEAAALASYALQLLTRQWDLDRAAIPVGLLTSWFELAAALDEPPPAPSLAKTWIELLPTDRIDLNSSAEILTLDTWTALCELLDQYLPDELSRFGFPQQQEEAIGLFCSDSAQRVNSPELRARREMMLRILWRICKLVPKQAGLAAGVASRLEAAREEPEFPVEYTPRPISLELQRILDTPIAEERSDEVLVARVLDDL